MKISIIVLLVSVLAAYCVDLSMYICAPDMSNCGISVSSCTLDNKTPDGDCFALDPCIGTSVGSHGSFVASGGGYELRGFSDANCNTQVSSVGASLTNAGCTTIIPAWTCSFIIREGTPAITGNAWNGWQYAGDCSTMTTMTRGPVAFGECGSSPYCSSDWIKVTEKAGVSDRVDIEHFGSQSDCMSNMNRRGSGEATIFDLEARPQGSCSSFPCSSGQSPLVAFSYASIGVPAMVPSTGMTPTSGNMPTTMPPTQSVTGNTPTTGMTPSASTSNTPTTMAIPTTTMTPTTSGSTPSASTGSTPSTGMTPSASTTNTPTTMTIPTTTSGSTPSASTGNTPSTGMMPSGSSANTPTTMTTPTAMKTPTTTLAPTTTLSPASFSQQILPHVFVTVVLLFTLLL